AQNATTRQIISELNTKIQSAAVLQTDTLFNSTVNASVQYVAMLSAMYQWLHDNSKQIERNYLKSNYSQNFPNIRPDTTLACSQSQVPLLLDLTLRRHALVVFLNTAFQQELMLDAYAGQLASNLWSGDDFSEALSGEDTSNPSSSVISKMYEDYFPVVNGRTLPVISTFRSYMADVTAKGQKLYNQGKLGTGYYSVNTVLQKLRDMRDYVFPMGVSGRDISPSWITTAYQSNDTTKKTVLDNMLYNLDKVDSDGNSAVMLSVQSCDYPTVLALLNKGVSVNLVNKKRLSSLDLALNCLTQTSQLNMLTLLVNHGATMCTNSQTLTNLLGMLSSTVPAVANVPCAPTRVPSTSVPTTKQPTTAVPSTKQPTTRVLTTGVPTTLIPSTKAPTTATPSTRVPSTAVPTTKQPTTAVPSTKQPTSHVPSTKQPTTHVPTTRAPSTKRPTTHVPTTRALSTKQPTTHLPPPPPTTKKK
ncbi:MAG: hypothetical protein WCK49_10420, partial [Myxococcaceae bacterium]